MEAAPPTDRISQTFCAPRWTRRPLMLPLVASVLIVDDDIEGCEPVAMFLRSRGHRVVCASNGREALPTLTGALPDVVILDMRMPHMDGLAFLQVLRSYLRWEKLPVILVTAYPEGPQVERAKRLGVSTVFRKGEVDLQELLASVERHTRPPELPDSPQPDPDGRPLA